MTNEQMATLAFGAEFWDKATDQTRAHVYTMLDWCRRHADFIADGGNHETFDIIEALKLALPKVSGMFYEDVFSRSRCEAVIRWRYMAVAIWYTRTVNTQHSIGTATGYDHSTLSRAITQNSARRNQDAKYNADYLALKEATYYEINKQLNSTKQ